MLVTLAVGWSAAPPSASATPWVEPLAQRAGGPGLDDPFGDDLGSDLGADLDFGGDLGGDLDFGDDLGGDLDFEDDLGGDLGFDDPSFGGEDGRGLDEGGFEDPLAGTDELGDDPFGAEADPFGAASLGRPGQGPGGAAPLGAGVGTQLTALADLLDELKQRGVRAPISPLAAARLASWAQAQGTGEDVRRAEDLLVAAASRGRDLPLGEAERIRRLRGGGEAVSRSLDRQQVGSRSGPGEGLGDLGEGLDGDFGDLDGDLGDLDAGFDDLDEDLGDLDGVGGLAELGDLDGLDEPVDPGTGVGRATREGADLFEVYRLRREVAAALFRSPSGDELAALLAAPGEVGARARAGLGALAGTQQGREVLARAIERGLDLESARALADHLGDEGEGEDRSLLARLARRVPEVARDVARAEGRIAEREQRGVGLDRWQRDSQAGLLLQQAAARARAEDLPGAHRLARQAAALASDPRVALHRASSYAYNLGRYPAAREHLEALLRRGTTAYRAWTDYAKVLRRLGESDALVQALEGALRGTVPTDLKVRLCNELALEYAIRGDGPRAIQVARIGLDHFVPREVRDNLLTRLAEGQVLTGRLDEAERNFEAALRLDPAYRKARLGLEALRDLRGLGVRVAVR